jgi:hypothetical protein
MLNVISGWRRRVGSWKRLLSCFFPRLGFFTFERIEKSKD